MLGGSASRFKQVNYEIKIDLQLDNLLCPHVLHVSYSFLISSAWMNFPLSYFPFYMPHFFSFYFTFSLAVLSYPFHIFVKVGIEQMWRHCENGYSGQECFIYPIRCWSHPFLFFGTPIYHLWPLSLLGDVSICCLHWCSFLVVPKHLPLLF